jgi:[protein-PII] uridylyltransferase
MQAYYRHAQIVAQTAERVILRARPQERRGSPKVQDLGDGCSVFDGQVTFTESDYCAADPAAALRFYEHVAGLGLPPYAYARDQLARIVVDDGFQARLRQSAEAREAFLRLLVSSAGAPVRRGSILGELHELGLLLAMIPEFEPVTGRVQHDVYHIYTVDVHSIAAVDRLHALVRGDLADELPLASRLATEMPRPVPLFVGLLLHDIGKARGKDHSRAGAELAGPIATRLGLSPVDVDHVVWLVREHLHLYHWAMRRDTNDPDTLAEIARHVGTAERLRDLYLLTVADLSTTNPNAMTSWKAQMLDEVYLGVLARLEGGVETVRSRAAELRERTLDGISDSEALLVRSFLEGMPDRYVLANPAESIRRHARIATSRSDAGLVVELLPGSSPGMMEVVVISDDRPGLLADVAAVLARHRLSVTGAQIYTRQLRSGVDEAVDVFMVRETRRSTVDGGKSLVDSLQSDLVALLRGEITPRTLLRHARDQPRWAERRVPEVPTKVGVDNAASNRFTVVDVYTRDRLGLLHVIARTLHELGLSIALSKVHTEGLRAADVFYVMDSSGGRIEDPERCAAISKALKDALDRFHAEWEGGA